MILALPPVRDMIEAEGLFAKRNLGQNFLTNLSIMRRIAAAAGTLSADSNGHLSQNLKGSTVYEVGPGPGGLTRALLELGAEEIFAVEKDCHCLPILTQIQSLSQGRLTLIEGDALKIIPQNLTTSPFKIVANLPYNIGTALLIQWLRKLENIQSLTLMFQKEVALRIIAKPRTKEYGRLSILCQWLCDTKKLFDLPPSAFFPSPKVTSSVVQLIPRSLSIEETKLLPCLEKITHDAFGQRRKMLRTSLKNLISQETFEILGINPQARAEELSVAQFIQLAASLSL